MQRILVVDDEDIFRDNLAQFLGDQGYFVETAAEGREAMELLEDGDFALALVDIRMPETDGIELLERINSRRPDTAVILMTAHASVETAVEGFRKGIHDYILKPLSFEDVVHKVEQVLEHRRMRNRIGRLRRRLQERLGFEGMVGDSDPMQEVYELIDRVAQAPTTVLLTGESGTGKELAARAIHERSEVADNEFLAVNMGAMNPELIEAQLFGAQKGAYTGSDRRREGIFRTVRGGTVFLDEVGEMPLEAQAKLLRTVEHREVMPLGSSEPVSVEFRLVAATNRDLEQMVEEGTFRRDLYYRLNIFHIEMPPLRDRPKDIPALAEHFAERHARKLKRPVPTFSNEAMKALMDYEWPGNVRELSNVIERALIVATDDKIGANHLPCDLTEVDRNHAPMSLEGAVEQAERDQIRQALELTDGNRSEAAELLQVDPATLYRRLEKYGLD